MGKGNPNFRLKAVAELLDGNHHFFIPSFQRGYRWDKKQVEDLLKDIWDFAKDDQHKKSDFYCLQPIVVKKKSESNVDWIVIDGQQRLTTLFLLLEYIMNGSRAPFVMSSIMYDIKYDTRKELDFTNPNKILDIDSFHVFQAKSIIEKWFSDRINEIDPSALEKVLFNKSKEVPQVKVIWYVTDNENDIESIKIFNNLNKGKISLTNAELIKALFILKAGDEEDEKLNINEFAFEWNQMENALHNDTFWYFLANKEYHPATRIDIIFDFLTGKSDKDDSDFSYRKFQNLYDNTKDSLWADKKVNTFTDAWKNVKEVFHTFVYWFEDSTLYHYIGYLIYWGIPLGEIFDSCKGKSKTLVVKEIQNLIKDKIFKNIKDIDDLIYPDDKQQCHKVLLFFNIETCVKQQININMKISESYERDSETYYKFPFDLCKLYDWDIEHVGSQTENPLKKIKEKIIWLTFIENIFITNKELEDINKWKALKKESKKLRNSLINIQKDEKNVFDKLYKDILAYIQPEFGEKGEKNNGNDSLGNLVLLDEGTNRGYRNALFPSKRQIIIEKDKDGIFIPVCTKNLFLKYYTREEENPTYLKINWTKDDRSLYLQAIHETIDFILPKEA